MSQSFGGGDASARAEHQTLLQVRHEQQYYRPAASAREKDSALKLLHGSVAYRQQVGLVRVQVREQLGAGSSRSPAL